MDCGTGIFSDLSRGVPQGYAWEMTTAEGGWGLDGILKNKQHVLNGVVNGIDMLEWDPSADEHTAASYSVDDLSGLHQDQQLAYDPCICMKPTCTQSHD